MADHRAVAATCEAVVKLLRQSWNPTDFNNAAGQFRVFRNADFDSPPITLGGALFLYRVSISGVQRTLPPRPREDGQRERRQLPVELQFMLTPIATTAALEQQIGGWMMRVLEDNPTLDAGLLNSTEIGGGIFNSDELVEIIAGQLSNEEMFRIWDVLPGDYQLSFPYVARTVRIESRIAYPMGEPVIERDLEFGAWKRS